MPFGTQGGDVLGESGGKPAQQPWPLRRPSQPETTESSLLESTNSPSSVGGNVPAGHGPEETSQTMLALLAEMEASLRGSHRAVLRSNGLLLENCTREQARLHRALELLLIPAPWPGTGDAGRLEKTGAAKKSEKKSGRLVPLVPQYVQQRVPRCASPLGEELLAAERRVLDATRVQAALLRRARQFQRILKNFAATQGAIYPSENRFRGEPGSGGRTEAPACAEP